METTGYICRFLAHDNTANLTLFIVQTLTILVAPALFAASVYMVLGRLVLLVKGEAYLVIKPSRLTKIFVGGDILCFFIQIIGSGTLSSKFNLGKAIILVGLIAQIVFFGLFVLVAAIFHRRHSRNPTPTAQMLDEDRARLRWKDITRVIFVVSAMIFVRSLFRLIEFTGDSNSPIMKSEAYLYVCDSTLMLVALVILIYWHPAEYVGNRKDILQMQHEEMS